MIALGGIESAGITDKTTGHPILVSTSARILFRKYNPSWQKVPNKDLNYAIAQQYATAKIEDHFRPKKNPEAQGEIRNTGGSKMAGINYGDRIVIISVKGTPKINTPAPSKPLKQRTAPELILPSDESSPNPFDHLKEVLSHLDPVKAYFQEGNEHLKGFFEDHYYNAVKEMYAADGHNIDDLLEHMLRIEKDRGKALKRLKEMPKDEISKLIGMLLHKNKFQEMDMSGAFSQNPGTTAVDTPWPLL